MKPTLPQTQYPSLEGQPTEESPDFHPTPIDEFKMGELDVVVLGPTLEGQKKLEEVFEKIKDLPQQPTLTVVADVEVFDQIKKECPEFIRQLEEETKKGFQGIVDGVIPNLGGFVCVRNGILLDYCFELAIQSLLEVCSEVVVCDSDSTDGTTELLQRWVEKEPRIKLVNWPWTNPKGVSHHAWIEWLNFARKHLTTPHCVYVDADEVLDTSWESRLSLVESVTGRKSLRVDRLNFFRDPKSLIPEGECCGKWCVRVGPTEYESVSDQPAHPGEFKIVDEAIDEPRVKIYHLGFLRDKDAFYRKSRAVLAIWFNRFDERLERGEKDGKPVHETEITWKHKLVPFTGTLPTNAAKWLEARGHDTLP